LRHIAVEMVFFNDIWLAEKVQVFMGIDFDCQLCEYWGMV
jgi:hypothetical protein